MSKPRKFIVSGATSGIGYAICQMLLQQGEHVLALGRDFSRFAGECAHLTPVELDFSDLKALPNKLKNLGQKHPDIDGLICCAGRGQFGSLEEFSYEQIQSLMDLNFTSQAYLTRAFLPLLKRQKQGSLIYIGSESALSGGRRGAVYCASKFALRGMAQALREECGRSNIKVCVVNPGMVNTAFFDQLNFSPGEDEANYVTAEDVAEAVALVLNSRVGTVFDEINLSPLKKVIRFK